MPPGIHTVVLPALVGKERSEIGGTAAYVIELEKRLRARGVRTLVLGFGTVADSGEGFTPVVTRSRPRARDLTWALWRRRGRWDFPADALVHVQRPDQALGFAGGPWPLVVSIHGCHRRTLGLRQGRAAGWLYGRLVGRMVRRADALLFETRHDQEGMAPEGSALHARSHFIPLGIDRGFFSPGDQAAARRKLGLPPDVRAIGYLGRLEAEKNVPGLIRAMERVPGVELWIAGKGAEEADCRALAGPRVRFLGFLPTEDVPVFIRAADALGLASHHEGLATVALQAWAVGRPLVVPPVGDFPTLLGEDGGILAPDNSPGSLAAAVDLLYERLLPTPERRRALETGLRAKSKAYDWERIVEQVLGVYELAAARRRAA